MLSTFLHLQDHQVPALLLQLDLSLAGQSLLELSLEPGSAAAPAALPTPAPCSETASSLQTTIEVCTEKPVCFSLLVLACCLS